MSNILAKIGGWTFFILSTVGQIATTGIHGWQGWLQAIGALAVAVGVHAASNSAPTTPTK